MSLTASADLYRKAMADKVNLSGLPGAGRAAALVDSPSVDGPTGEKPREDSFVVLIAIAIALVLARIHR